MPQESPVFSSEPGWRSTQKAIPRGRGCYSHPPPVLQMGKLRHSRGKRFAQGPT